MGSRVNLLPANLSCCSLEEDLGPNSGQESMDLNELHPSEVV